jgi:hypothetical protein
VKLVRIEDTSTARRREEFPAPEGFCRLVMRMSDPSTVRRHVAISSLMLRLS